ncbi:MAG: hypothetical protein ABEI76_08580 [Halobacteriales archaeon]
MAEGQLERVLFSPAQTHMAEWEESDDSDDLVGEHDLETDHPIEWVFTRGFPDPDSGGESDT